MKKFKPKRHDMVSRIALTLGLAGAFVSPALAQESRSEDIVVTGTATPVDYSKVGNVITVVPESVIKDGGYIFVADVLRQVPGVAVSRTGPAGGLTQVRIRGAEGNHTLALLDGIDMSGPDGGETDFSTLLSGDIQRIEILRGPQSGLYGSNALAGVVNVITSREINGSYHRIEAEGGEFNTAQLQGSAGIGNGARYFSAGFHALSSRGYDVSPPIAAVPFVGVRGERGDDEGNSIVTFYLRGGAKLSDILRVDGIARYFNKASEVDGQAFNPPIAGRTYDDASFSKNHQVLVGGSATLSLLEGKWTSILSGSYVDDSRYSASTNFGSFLASSAANVASAPTQPLSPFATDSDRTKILLQSTLEFGAAPFRSFLTGFVERQEASSTNPLAATPITYTRELVGYGAQYRAELFDQLYLSGTIRHDENDNASNAPSNPQPFDDADTYSVSASWVIPNIGTRPHASVGTGITNPTFLEQFGSGATYVGNPDLKPEKADGWDVGVEQTLLDKRLVVDVTYFESTLEDEISFFFNAALAKNSFRNALTDSPRRGYEATLRFYPTENIDIAASYTALKASEPAGIEIRRPEDQASLDATFRIPDAKLKFNLGVTYNGEQLDTDFGTFLRTRQDPYTLVRVGASYMFTEALEGYVRVENVTDEVYEEVIGYRGQPRGAFIGLRFRGGSAK